MDGGQYGRARRSGLRHALARAGRVGRLAVGVLMLAWPVGGQEIGTIAGAETVSRVKSGSDWIPATRGLHVGIGNSMQTTTGRLAVLLFDDYRPNENDLFELAPDTELTIASRASSGAAEYALVRARLHRGGVRWIGPGEVLADPLAALAHGTEFIVYRYPETQIAEVIVLSGRVEVWNTLIASDRVSVGPRQRTRVDPRWPPTAPEAVDDAELRSYAATFSFVGGGRAEGQSSGSGLLSGEEVAVADRAGGLPAAAVPGEDPLRSESESPPFDQPEPVVTDPDLRIDF